VLLAINNSRTKASTIAIPLPADRYTLTAESLEAKQVQLNGLSLRLEADDALPALRSAATPAGSVELAPVSITFLTIKDAANPACR
jgi:hypothetical protein